MKRVSLILIVCMAFAGSARAKEAGFSLKDDAGIPTLKDLRLTLPGDLGSLAFTGRNRLRYEAWDYFTSAADNDYEFLANQLRLGGRWVHDYFNVNYTHQYTQLSNLPTATSPGAGAGSLHFSNSRNRNSHAQFVKFLNVELKQIYRWPLLKPVIGDWKFLRGFSATAGRFSYSSGNEMKSNDAKMGLVKAQRVGDRLIGTFEWSHYGRSFDGAKFLYENDVLHGVAGVFSPTQGGFEERANRSIPDIDVRTAELTVKKGRLLPGAEENFFYYHYDDHRNIAATTTRIDNTGRALPAGSASNIEFHTFGASAIGLYPLGPGQVDVVGWFACQTGDWFELDHSAYAYAAEAGWQWTDHEWKPWIRAGYNVGSGDDDPADADHNAFFQMLPTARLYSASILYNLMNTEDAFVSLAVRPRFNLLLKTDFHVLDLSEKADRWYLGSGPMHDNIFDDYAARSSSNRADLGELLDFTAVWTVNPDVTLMAYYGHFFGGDVVKDFFTSQRRNDFLFVELAVNF